MHLVMDVLRICAVKALYGKTWAGQGVFDSPASPADLRVRGKRAPFIAVYVDEQDIVGPMNGSLGMPGEENTVRLLLEVGVASSRMFGPDGSPVPDDQPVPQGSWQGVSLDATDRGLELQMGLISRQAIDALSSTAENNPWAQIFNGLAPAMVQSVRMRRGGPPNDQVRPQSRYASRITVIELGTLSEPVRGADLADYPWWTMFFQACQGDEDLSDVGELIKAHILPATGPLPAWRVIQKQLGIPRETAIAIGLGPLTDDEDEPELKAAKVEDGGAPPIPPRDDPDRQGVIEE